MLLKRIFFFFLVQAQCLKKSFCYFGQVTARAWEQEGQPAAQTAHKSDLESSECERLRSNPLIHSHRWLWPPGVCVLQATSVHEGPCSLSSSPALQEPGAALQEPKICPRVGRVPRVSTATAPASSSPPGSVRKVRVLVIELEEGVVKTAEA